MKGVDKDNTSSVMVVKEKGRICGIGLKLDKFRFNRSIGKNWLSKSDELKEQAGQ